MLLYVRTVLWTIRDGEFRTSTWALPNLLRTERHEPSAYLLTKQIVVWNLMPASPSNRGVRAATPCVRSTSTHMHACMHAVTLYDICNCRLTETRARSALEPFNVCNRSHTAIADHAKQGTKGEIFLAFT